MAKKLPNASHCFVCGFENPSGLNLSFTIDDHGEVNCQAVIDERFQGYPGIVHGGIIAAMLDETLARAVMAEDPHRFMVTGRLTTRYRKPAPIGEPLELVGRVLKDRGQMAECAAFLYNTAGELCAEATGLLIPIPEEILSTHPDMRWEILPD